MRIFIWEIEKKRTKVMEIIEILWELLSLRLAPNYTVIVFSVVFFYFPRQAPLFILPCANNCFNAPFFVKR